MTTPDIEQALTGLKPKKKAAQVREWMPLIEQKLAAGVLLDDIVTALVNAGVAINKATLKNYLYRHRKSQSSTGTEAVSKNIAAKTLKPVNNASELPLFPDMTPERMDYYENLATEEA